jgi:ElaB/YqjD/DUF883 family membrane-anchored ribosome-binding protein
MTNGDEDTADADAEPDASADDSEPEPESGSPAAFDDRLSDAESDLEAAETEDDLDDVAATLDDIESDIEAADLPVPDEDEEADDPREDLESRLSSLRDDLEAKRGPYVEDAAELVEDAESTVGDTRWTDDGHPDVVAAVETFLDDVGSVLVETFETDGDDRESLADALGNVADVLGDTDLDPDADADAIAALIEAAETLQDDLDAAEEWDDLTIHQQLDHEGFYDVLDGENRKDFPPEWSALKVHEKRGNVDQVLLALDRKDSDYFEEYVMHTLKRMAPAEAYEAVDQRAQRRGHLPVEILGKIGDDRALDTLHGYLDADPALAQVALRATGEIGSEESTQPVADRLVAEDSSVRSSAARALGLIGDTRAIDPLADVLEDDAVDEVRASAAWALRQIGTERALDVASDYADDDAFLVETEARKAADATDAAGSA